MLTTLKESLAEIPEHRQGENLKYEIAAAGLASFGVFFMQSPSFLAHPRDMQRRKGENNASSLFEVRQIPSDGQIRNLLDPLDAGQMATVLLGVYAELAARGYLADYQGVAETRLISLDGTQYFSSQKVHCDNCRVTVKDEEKHYTHQVLLAVLCAAEQAHVVCLDPGLSRLKMGTRNRPVSSKRSNAGWIAMPGVLSRGA